MKQLKLKSKSDELQVQDSGSAVPNIEELRAQRKARLEINQRVDNLKVSLMRIADHNLDHAVRLLRRWLNEA